MPYRPVPRRVSAETQQNNRRPAPKPQGKRLTIDQAVKKRTESTARELSMAENTAASSEESPRSRRAMLAGIAGAVATAAVLTTDKRAEAATGDPLVLGQSNSATARTSLVAETSGTSESALEVQNTGLSSSAIVATATGIGIRSTGISGVVGSSNSPNGSGLLGEDNTFDSFGRGVIGISHNGWGVVAISGGQALRVEGRAVFKDRSGIVSISYPSKSATVTVGGPALVTLNPGPPSTPGSTVLAVMQTNLAGVWVRAAVPAYGTNSVTIFLNKAPGSQSSPKSVTVAWFVVN